MLRIVTTIWDNESLVHENTVELQQQFKPSLSQLDEIRRWVSQYDEPKSSTLEPTKTDQVKRSYRRSKPVVTRVVRKTRKAKSK
jgi:hypothetical protein